MAPFDESRNVFEHTQTPPKTHPGQFESCEAKVRFWGIEMGCHKIHAPGEREHSNTTVDETGRHQIHVTWL